MGPAKEQIRLELERRYAVAKSLTHGDDPLDFDLFIRITDYVAFVESSPILTSILDADRKKRNRKTEELVPTFGTNFLGRLRKKVQLNDLNDFHFSRPYKRLLRVYYVANYLNDKIQPPKDFFWKKGFKRAVRDMDEMRPPSFLLPRLFSRNSFHYSPVRYAYWLEKVHLGLLAALATTDFTANKPKAVFEFVDHTGAFRYGNIEGVLTPGSQEYKVFTALYKAENNAADYLTLVRAMHPSAESASKTQKGYLHKVIYNIKSKFGIPETNPDVFRNNRGDGYQLVFPDKNTNGE